MLILKKDDIKKCFTMRDAIEADKEALEIYSEGKAKVPLRTNIDIDEKNGQNLYMPAYVGGNQTAAGLKIVSVYPDNISKGLPSVPATVITLDADTGELGTVIEGTYLTQLRTGAVQGAATELLARKDAKVGALIGTGGQAATQLEAMIEVRDLEEIRIFDIDFSRAKKFAELMADKFNKNIYPCQTAKECVENADIITTVTTSKRATFNDEWVKPGAHINGIGAYTPEMCEIPCETIKRAKTIVFDTLDGVWQEAGDFIQPLNKGEISKDMITGELGQLVAGKIKGRTSDDEITIFKTVGTAVLDVYIADKIVKKAQANGYGHEFELN